MSEWVIDERWRAAIETKSRILRLELGDDGRYRVLMPNGVTIRDLPTRAAADAWVDECVVTRTDVAWKVAFEWDEKIDDPERVARRDVRSQEWAEKVARDRAAEVAADRSVEWPTPYAAARAAHDVLGSYVRSEAVRQNDPHYNDPVRAHDKIGRLGQWATVADVAYASHQMTWTPGASYYGPARDDITRAAAILDFCADPDPGSGYQIVATHAEVIGRLSPARVMQDIFTRDLVAWDADGVQTGLDIWLPLSDAITERRGLRRCGALYWAPLDVTWTADDSSSLRADLRAALSATHDRLREVTAST